MSRQCNNKPATKKNEQKYFKFFHRRKKEQKNLEILTLKKKRAEKILILTQKCHPSRHDLQNKKNRTIISLFPPLFSANKEQYRDPPVSPSPKLVEQRDIKNSQNLCFCSYTFHQRKMSSIISFSRQKNIHRTRIHSYKFTEFVMIIIRNLSGDKIDNTNSLFCTVILFTIWDGICQQ